MDHLDARLMSAFVNLAAGRFAEARAHADAMAAMPSLREEPHVALGRRIEVDAVAGRHDDVVALAPTFREGWHRAGRPQVNNLAVVAAAVAMVHGLAGRSEDRAEWIDVATGLLRDPHDLGRSAVVWSATFDATVALHEGDPVRALALLTSNPDDLADGISWYGRLWLPWYAAAWAEASVLVRSPDAEERLGLARRLTRGNDVAGLLVERASVLWGDTAEDLAGMADRFAGLGAVYQAGRTRTLAAGRGAPETTEPPDPPEPPVGLGVLSHRELEVLRLVAAGHTNAQIGAELFISRKTAEHHVSSILTKLGATNRAEAAALAIRHGLGTA
ncbi:response regulator transcription factor [Nocardioides sp. SYSU D00038]|uniref:helix-turn-helix transcriptional regulator n=1 Tax=Nocardioides sp. SYSU D00038 TaxID=2812554 RepID=UPI001F0841C0|nr:response regulator transcription factor [Nocardioides sp. SYSU D00038]